MPKQQNYADIIRQTLLTQVGLEPTLLGAEQQYSPFQTNLTLSNLNDLLFGSQGGSLDVQHFTPSIFQEGNKMFYGHDVPAGYTGIVDTPTLPRFGGGNGGTVTAPGTGATLHRAPGDSWLGITGSNAGDAALEAVVPVAGLFGGSSPVRLAKPNQWTETRTVGAEPGLIEQMNQATSAQRAADIGDIQTLGPGAHDAILAANPELAALLTQLNDQARTGLESGSGLTPDEQRWVQQATRGAWAARGMDGSNGAAADEVLNQYALGQNLLGRRQAFAQNVAGFDQGELDRILALLSRQGNEGPSALSMLQGPMFNPESPFAGNISAANQQMKALFADPSTLSKINQTAQTTSNVLGTVGSMASFASI